MKRATIGAKPGKWRLGGNLRLAVVTALIFLAMVASCSGAPKVLLVVRDYANKLSFFVQEEALPMISLLHDAGYSVDILTSSGKPIQVEQTVLNCDVTASQVQLDQYQALVIPCMGGGDFPVPKEIISLVKEAYSKHLFIAAQNSSEVFIDAGMVAGHKLAINPGVVRDGTLMTSFNCPEMAQVTHKPVDTPALISTLVAALQQ